MTTRADWTDAGITVLDAAACWDRLAGEEVGRLAVAVGGYPEIFPVNYAVVDETIVFRTAEGTKLLAVTIGPAAAFEVDGFDATAGLAWSVVVKGTAAEVPVHEQPDDDAFPVFPWSGAPKPRFLRITPVEVTGRELQVVRRRPGAVGNGRPA